MSKRALANVFGPTFRAPRGFTLIELLTVIAIIGVLASIIITTTGQVRAKAKQTACITHLRQIGIGVSLYANDNRGRLPPVVDLTVNPGKNWEVTGWFPQLMQAYVDAPKTWNCPSQPEERSFGLNGAWRARKNWYIPSYAINSAMAGKLVTNVVNGISNGNNQVFMTEGQASFWDSASISASENYVQTPHAGSQTNTFLFADGRVETGAKADMVAYTQGGGSTYRIITLKKYRP